MGGINNEGHGTNRDVLKPLIAMIDPTYLTHCSKVHSASGASHESQLMVTG